MSRNWDEIGIAWAMESVSKQPGGHASDKVEVGKGPIPELIDITKAVAAGLGEAILAGLNGTSWRVKAQGVIRSTAEMKDGRRQLADVEAMKEKVYQKLLGMRNVSARTTVVEVKVRPLPNGSEYKGTEETEFRALYIAALVDLGIAADQAQLVCAGIKW